MSIYMHCRPCCGTHPSTGASSFPFVHSGYITTSNYHTYTPSTYRHHDQAPPPPVPPRRRRRLEDPIITYASNYYATFPRQISQSPPRQPSSPPSQPRPPPLPPPRRNHQQSDCNRNYCDLFNLLERSSPPSIRQRRKYSSNNHSPRRYHHPIDFENPQAKPTNTNDRKCHHHKCTYYIDNKRQEDKLSSTEQYNRSPEKSKQINDIYQRRSSNKGFFRRVIRNYLCVPSTLTNTDYSS